MTGATQAAKCRYARSACPNAGRRRHKHRRRRRSKPRWGPWRTTEASEYGEGDNQLYGPLACGGIYLPSDRGVANKTLACGTLVEFRYRGRRTTATVMDRGPYVAGREWDLQIATARALGFQGLGQVSARIRE